MLNGRPVCYWLLPDQELHNGLSDTPEVDEWLAQWLKQYPPPTPPDDDEIDGDSA
jgi:hypothetical protein